MKASPNGERIDTTMVQIRRLSLKTAGNSPISGGRETFSGF
jgi:hypothetical protein